MRATLTLGPFVGSIVAAAIVIVCACYGMGLGGVLGMLQVLVIGGDKNNATASWRYMCSGEFD